MLAALVALSLSLSGTALASYTITSINTTLTLNSNNTASVIEILNVSISNQSIAQYSSDRLAQNLTLSTWQPLVGPQLVEHIINPRGSIYDFNFIPGPMVSTPGGDAALMKLSYYVTNVTSDNQTGPRLFTYTFNPSVFNFVHAVSGEVLGNITSLTIILPPSAHIVSVYPVPDAPASAFAHNYRNTTKISWFQNEPLSNFALTYTVTESLQAEVLGFFGSVYEQLGLLDIAIIILVAAALAIAYAYIKASR